MTMTKQRILLGLALLALTASIRASDRPSARLEYNRDIRPILSENCFACHGADKNARKAALRLDRREDALDTGAIVPGSPQKSLLIERVFASDAKKVMPPLKTRHKLAAAQKETLQRWIAAGAEYQPHWAFIPPKPPTLPSVRNVKWVRNAIDAFILAELEKQRMEPAPEADRRALARRVSLDLTGLPPDPTIVERFVVDCSPDAYEHLVDRLLDSPEWGEHRARYWLDAARYADTHGIHFDNYREIWAYRDWVIAAFNRNLPFDQFTIEQLAGDLLPRPTLEQLVATGFNRCNITTNEGGVIAEEYLVLYNRERTEATSRVWMGITANCAVCHDHKFDPLTQREFYSMAAYFNNTTQPAMDGNIKDTPPVVPLPQPEDMPRWNVLRRDLPALQRDLWAALLSGWRTLKDPHLVNLLVRWAQLHAEENAIRARGTIAYVMQERHSLPVASVLYRGEYNHRRDRVGPGTPTFLPPMPPDYPRNRLGFARWLMRPEQPLTARVTVNRAWQEVFGAGIVRTSDDFGLMGEPPSHQELLDWLAVEFRESGWDIKRLYRLLVTSATYRQSAVTTPLKLDKDPQNRLLSRGPRFRMDAEMVRDAALAASGLLVSKIGGPSVRPYQPEGVWEAVAMIGSDTRDYHQDHGADLYRRSMYTFWKRAAPPASMEIFNAPTRETCAVRRERTNTPLQALVTLNDPQFVEAARNLAQRAIRSGGNRDTERLDFMGRELLARSFRKDEQAVLKQSLSRLLGYYQEHETDARKLIAVGESAGDSKINPATLAAWTMVANELMNLDEFLNK
jgi:hypothetical protein